MLEFLLHMKVHRKRKHGLLHFVSTKVRTEHSIPFSKHKLDMFSVFLIHATHLYEQELSCGTKF